VEAISPEFDLTFRPGFRLTKPMGGMRSVRVEQADAVSFRALVEEHSRMVFRVAWRMTGNVEDAEDVVQETFLKAHRGYESFDARARFGTWIYRIAVNCSIDVLRRRRSQGVAPRRTDEEEIDPVEAIPSNEPVPEQRAFAGEIGRRVASALSRLSERERAAFVLRHLEGLSIEGIADVLKIGPNAVKQTVFRAVQKLRRELAPIGSVS